MHFSKLIRANHLLDFAFLDLAAEQPLLDVALSHNIDGIKGLVWTAAFPYCLRRYRDLQGSQHYQGHTPGLSSSSR